MLEDVVYTPSNPPENLEELRWWLQNETIMISNAVEALRDANSSRNYPKWEAEKLRLNLMPGQTTPSATAVLSSGLWVFADTYSSTAALSFNVKLPHGIKEEATVNAVLRTANINSIAGGVKWGIEYRLMNDDEVIGTAQSVTVTQTLGGTADKCDNVQIAAIDLTGYGVMSSILGKLYRLGGDAGDTATGSIALIDLCLNFRRDADGSRQEYVK